MNLVLRIISAVVLLPLVLALVHKGGWYIFGFMTVASAICLYEYGGIVAKDDVPSRVFLIVVGDRRRHRCQRR